jgi:membrane fusion protein (multidrug efflux system)
MSITKLMNNAFNLAGITILASVLASGCTGKSDNRTLHDEGIAVKVLEVKIRPEKEAQDYVGTVEESVSVPVSFLASGQAERVMVAEGDRVTKGKLLAELNSSNYQSLYSMAASKEKQAEDAWKRLSDLYKKGSLPEIKYIEVQSDLEQAHSAAQIAQKNLQDCKLFAPADGIVGKRSIEPGMTVLPAVPVFTLVKISKVFVKVAIPENEISRIRTGQKARVWVTALDNEGFEGVIEEKGIMANPLSHTYLVKIAVNNPEEKLMPGMVCNVLIDNPDSTGSLVIPQQSVMLDNEGQKYVYLVNPVSSKVILKRVTTGSVKPGGVAILSGLATGDFLIVEGYQKVTENATVKIVR